MSRKLIRRAVLGKLAAAASLIALAGSSRAVAASRSFDLAISKAQLSADQSVISVQQGDDVTINVTTDRSVEVHLHGYEIEQAVTPGKPVSLHFTARSAGRFPIEVHEQGKHRVIVYLEVHPR